MQERFGPARLARPADVRSLMPVSSSGTTDPFRVVIAGGGVAALEAALALRELTGERVRTTLLSPEPEFVYRPMRVQGAVRLQRGAALPVGGDRAGH
jgi:hypothetical protein